MKVGEVNMHELFTKKALAREMREGDRERGMREGESEGGMREGENVRMKVGVWDRKT